MKEIIYYDEMCIPNQIRIVSEALCLDHTFSPAASQKIIGYKALLVLLRTLINFFTDFLLIFLMFSIIN